LRDPHVIHKREPSFANFSGYDNIALATPGAVGRVVICRHCAHAASTAAATSSSSAASEYGEPPPEAEHNDDDDDDGDFGSFLDRAAAPPVPVGYSVCACVWFWRVRAGCACDLTACRRPVLLRRTTSTTDVRTCYMRIVISVDLQIVLCKAKSGRSVVASAASSVRYPSTNLDGIDAPSTPPRSPPVRDGRGACVIAWCDIDWDVTGVSETIVDRAQLASDMDYVFPPAPVRDM
jgi:hypothetical protein